ncbi:MAG: ATP-binding protein [Pseudonocardiales bacterium]
MTTERTTEWQAGPPTVELVVPVAASTGTDALSRTRRRGIPARVRIMGWLILLMAVVLLSVTVVTRNLLLHQVEATAKTALEQEALEFVGVANFGENSATGARFRNAEELLHNHVKLQYPDHQEVIVAAVRDGTRLKVWHQQPDDAPLQLHERRDILDLILASSDPSGAVATDAGELRWVRVVVSIPTEPSEQGMYVVGYFIGDNQAEVDRTVRTLLLVSLLGLLLAAGASWLVAGRILAPVRLVHTAAAQITEQDLTRRIPGEGNDEFAALAEQFNAMLDRLEQAFATQREFLDDASHELRTPITIIRGHLELLDPVTSEPAERVAVVRLCTDELDRMSRMVEDLLLLAKAERPDFLRPERVEVAELTSDVDAKVRTLGDRRWRLESIGEGTVTVDPQRVTQAMVQLAHNAVQHTEDDQEILLGSALHGGRVVFWITDHGPGVSPEDVQVIFERFSRGSTSGRRGHRSGAGLGLAIVRTIAEAHHGVARLAATPGGGASFIIELPAHPGQPS